MVKSPSIISLGKFQEVGFLKTVIVQLILDNEKYLLLLKNVYVWNKMKFIEGVLLGPLFSSRLQLKLFWEFSMPLVIVSVEFNFKFSPVTSLNHSLSR